MIENSIRNSNVSVSRSALLPRRFRATRSHPDTGDRTRFPCFQTRNGVSYLGADARACEQTVDWHPPGKTRRSQAYIAPCPRRDHAPPPPPPPPHHPAPAASLEAKPAAFPTTAKVIQPERPHRDVMGGAARVEIKCLDHGFVALIDSRARCRRGPDRRPSHRPVRSGFVWARDQTSLRRPRPRPLPPPPPAHHALRDGRVQVPRRDAHLHRPPVDPPPHGQRQRILRPLLHRDGPLLYPQPSRRSASSPPPTARAARKPSTFRATTRPRSRRPRTF